MLLALFSPQKLSPISMQWGLLGGPLESDFLPIACAFSKQAGSVSARIWMRKATTLKHASLRACSVFGMSWPPVQILYCKKIASSSIMAWRTLAKMAFNPPFHCQNLSSTCYTTYFPAPMPNHPTNVPPLPLLWEADIQCGAEKKRPTSLQLKHVRTWIQSPARREPGPLLREEVAVEAGRAGGLRAALRATCRREVVAVQDLDRAVRSDSEAALLDRRTSQQASGILQAGAEAAGAPQLPPPQALRAVFRALNAVLDAGQPLAGALTQAARLPPGAPALEAHLAASCRVPPFTSQKLRA